MSFVVEPEAGGLTFGRGFIPSLYINMESVLITSAIQRENPGVKLVGTIVGTGAGSAVGSAIVHNGRGAAVAAAINGNMITATTIANTVQPANAVLPSLAQEYFGLETEKRLNKK